MLFFTCCLDASQCAAEVAPHFFKLLCFAVWEPRTEKIAQEVAIEEAWKLSSGQQANGTENDNTLRALHLRREKIWKNHSKETLVTRQFRLCNLSLCSKFWSEAYNIAVFLFLDMSHLSSPLRVRQVRLPPGFVAGNPPIRRVSFELQGWAALSFKATSERLVWALVKRGDGNFAIDFWNVFWKFVFFWMSSFWRYPFLGFFRFSRLSAKCQRHVSPPPPTVQQRQHRPSCRCYENRLDVAEKRSPTWRQVSNVLASRTKGMFSMSTVSGWKPTVGGSSQIYIDIACRCEFCRSLLEMRLPHTKHCKMILFFFTGSVLRYVWISRHPSMGTAQPIWHGSLLSLATASTLAAAQILHILLEVLPVSRFPKAEIYMLRFWWGFSWHHFSSLFLARSYWEGQIPMQCISTGFELKLMCTVTLSDS